MRDAILALAGSSLVYGSGQVLLRAINVLLLPVFTAYLTPADYGVVSVLTLATFFLGPVFALSVPSAIGLIYFDEADPLWRARTITTALILMMATGTALIIVGIAIAPVLLVLLFPGTHVAAGLPLLLVVAIATTAITNVTQPMLFQLQLDQRARTFVVLTVVTSIVTIATSVVLVAGLRAGVLGFLGASLLGQLFGLVLVFAATQRYVSFQFDGHIARRLLSLGIPLVPSFLFLFVMFQANRYVIQIERGLGELGVYSIGFNLGYALNLVVAGFQNAWIPFFLHYRERQDEARSLFGRITTYYVIGVGSLTLLFFLAARPVVLVLTRPAFHDAYLVVGASAASQFLVGIYSLLLAGVYFVKDVRSVPVIQGISAVVGLVLNVVLIAAFGISGAGLALVVATATMVALLYVVNRLRGYLEIEYDWGRLARFGGLFVLIAVPFAMPRELPIGVEIAASAGGASLSGLVVLTLLTDAERRVLLRLPRRFLRRRSVPAS